MPLIPRDGKQGDCALLNERKKRYDRRWGLKEGLQGKKLHIARKLLRRALESGKQEHAVQATNALLTLPEEDKEKAIYDINGVLKNCKGGENGGQNAVMQSRTLSFVLMNLHQAEWNLLEGWEKTLPLLEDHSELLSDSLVMGSLNGTDHLAFETLAYLAVCGAYSYSPETLQRILNRFIERPEALMPYYNLTAVLTNEGPEELQQVADEMEDQRVSICREKLAYADDRQFEAGSELTALVALGRQYLVPELENVRDEMLDLMRDPGVSDIEREDYDDEEDFADAARLAKQRKQATRAKAAAVLKQMAEIGMPIAISVDGETPKELKKAEKLFCRLAEHEVDLHLEIEGGDREAVQKALETVPAENIHIAVSPDEVMALVGSVLFPQGESPEEAEANRDAAMAGLKPLLEAGLDLGLNIECPAESDHEEIAASLSRSLDILEMNDIKISLTFSGKKAKQVMALLGSRFMQEESTEAMAIFAALSDVFFPEGESMEEAEASRYAAIARLKEMQEMGMDLDDLIYPMPCPAEIDPEIQAAFISHALEALEVNGICLHMQYVGKNAKAVMAHMGADFEE